MSSICFRPGRRSAFTLVEILIVVMLMAILAAIAIPAFINTTTDARITTTLFDLNVLRSAVQQYRAQHGGASPSQSLVELISQTDMSGAVGAGSSYPYGPYMMAIPMNPFTQSSTVVAAGSNPPTATVSGAGWLYDIPSGQIWINDTTTPFASQ